VRSTIERADPLSGSGWTHRVTIDAEDVEFPWVVELRFDWREGPTGAPSYRCMGFGVSSRVADVHEEMPDLDRVVLGEIESRFGSYLGIATSMLELDFDAAVEKSKAMRAHGGRGRRGLRDDFFREIAKQYRRALAEGLRPTTAIADAHGVGRSTAASWVRRAREKGFLGAAQPGRAGEEES
jgi:hypothetical protein